MEIKKINLSELKLLEKNVRGHSERQIDELMKSVENFGQTRAVVIDENNSVLVGNGLVMAMIKMGKTDCDCYQITTLSEKEKKKLILSDNQIYNLGMDNFDVIEEMIKDINELDIAGFSNDYLEGLIMTSEDVEELADNYGKFEVEEDQRVSTVSTNEDTEVKVYTPTQTNTKEKVEMEFKEKPIRFIVCPKCGEKIMIE